MARKKKKFPVKFNLNDLKPASDAQILSTFDRVKAKRRKK